ncbi:MAG: 6-pyruvoyl tetrahydropterin synthase family protein [Thermonemataceae bacterium]
MATVYVSRKEHFNAAHKLYNPNWSKEKNQEVFGACANEYYHGHNFELIVTVKGQPNPDTGFVIDMKKLGQLIKKEITAKVDHHNLNVDVDFMHGIMPSCENFVAKIWEILDHPITFMGAETNAILHSFKLYETANNFVEYFGEE